MKFESGEESLPTKDSSISVHHRVSSQPELKGTGSALVAPRRPKRAGFNLEDGAEKFFVDKKDSMPRYPPDGELSKVMKIAQKYKSEGFRKKMYLQSQGLSD